MSSHLASRTVFRSPTLAIVDVRCRPRDGACGGEEHSIAHEIVLPRRGAFVKHVRGQSLAADANTALFFTRGEPYRVSHPCLDGDRCTVFSLRDDVLIDLIAAHQPAARDRPDAPFALPHGPSDASGFARHRTLLARLERQALPPVAVEETALQLLHAVLARVYRAAGRGRESRRASTQAAHRDAAHDARAFLARHWRDRLTLDQVARAVHCSPFHLCRVFAREVGVPIHRYVDRLRLRAGLDRIAENGARLTDLALDLGYSSYNHFADAFRREFGLSPAAYRRSVHPSRPREMSKILGD